MFQLDKQTANAVQRKDAVRLAKIQCRLRHGRYLRLVRILDDGQTAQLLDHTQPPRTIPIGARQ